MPENTQLSLSDDEIHKMWLIVWGVLGADEAVFLYLNTHLQCVFLRFASSDFPSNWILVRKKPTILTLSTFGFPHFEATVVCVFRQICLNHLWEGAELQQQQHHCDFTSKHLELKHLCNHTYWLMLNHPINRLLFFPAKATENEIYWAWQ